VSAIYAGPQCPKCNAALSGTQLGPGTNECPFCKTQFEATTFTPREHRHQDVQIVTETPDGVSAACANHARNAAVTSCSRCGLFICALCDMNVGEGSLCPNCFDRSRDQSVLGGATTRYRDYASMAISAAAFSLLCSTFFLPLGAFAVYWGVKGVKQRRAEGSGAAGPIIAIVVGSLQVLGLAIFFTAMIVGMVAGGK